MKTIFFLSLTTTLLLTGCNLTRILQPVVDTSKQHVLEATITESAPTTDTPALAIARPALPRYLNRRQLVDRDENNEIRINEYHLWSESLDSGTGRILARNLRALTGSTKIQPVDDFITLDYTALVEIKIAQLDPDEANNLILDCTWSIHDVHGESSTSHAFKTSVPIAAAATADTETRMRAHVTAMNEAIARLARDIAAKL